MLYSFKMATILMLYRLQNLIGGIFFFNEYANVVIDCLHQADSCTVILRMQCSNSIVLYNVNENQFD